MIKRISSALDRLSDFLARHRGLLPMIGILLILVNAILQFIPGQGWLVETDLLLHIGLILSLVGFLLAWAL